jgi:hypothetical protein
MHVAWGPFGREVCHTWPVEPQGPPSAAELYATGSKGQHPYPDGVTAADAIAALNDRGRM